MIINCPECGKPISDSAKSCIQCGFQFKKCEECGKILSRDSKTCTGCGHQFEQKKKSKKKEQTKQEIAFEEEQEKAKKVAAYIHKCNSVFKWLTAISIIIGIILLGVAIFKIVDFVSYKNKSAEEVFKLLTNAEEIRNSIHTLIIVSFICFTLPCVFDKFKTLFYSGLVEAKIREVGFDYRVYYGNYPEDESGEVFPPFLFLSESIFELIDEQLTECIRYKKDVGAIFVKILVRLIEVALVIGGLMLIYPVLIENIDSLLSLAILGKESNFEVIFNFNIVYGALMILFRMIVVDLFIETNLSDAHTWLKKVHNTYKETEETKEDEIEMQIL